MKMLDRLERFDFFGRKMFVNPLNNLYIVGHNPVYEPYATEVIMSMVKEGDVFVDLGANIGYYTLLAAEKVGNKGRVYAFEPESENFFILENNVKENQYDNVTLVKKAVYDKNEIVPFYVSGRSNSDHSLFEKAVRECCKIEEIETISLDHYFKNSPDEIDFIKIDIQGGELGALLGMKNILKKDNLIIFMEFWGKGFCRIGVNPKDIIDILLENGFQLFGVIENEHKLIPLNNTMDNFPLDQTNLLCTKGERK